MAIRSLVELGHKNMVVIGGYREDSDITRLRYEGCLRAFREYNDGALIAKDYPAWGDIDVAEEWATWARDIFLTEGWNT